MVYTLIEVKAKLKTIIKVLYLRSINLQMKKTDVGKWTIACVFLEDKNLIIPKRERKEFKNQMRVKTIKCQELLIFKTSLIAIFNS